MFRDQAKYCVYVLWLSGCSKQTISCWTGLSEGQVAGYIARSPWRVRTRLSIAERQQLVNDYRAVRFGEDGRPIDGGKLDAHDWLARESRMVRATVNQRHSRAVA